MASGKTRGEGRKRPSSGVSRARRPSRPLLPGPLRDMLDRVPIGCTVADPEGRILYWNEAAEQIFGFRCEEVAGRFGYGLIVREEKRPLVEHILGRLAGNDRSASGVVFENVHKDGHSLICEWHNVPLYDRSGRFTGLFSMVQDITDRMRADESLRKSEASLAKAQEIAHLGNWELDLANLDDVNSNALRWSDEVFRIFGYRPGEIEVSNEAFFKAVHPDDIPLITQAVTRSIEEGQPYRLEHRIIRPDGSERVVLEQSGLVRDSSGRPVRMVGTVQDITDRKKAEAALRESEMRFRATFEQAAVGIAHIAPEGRFLRVNQKLCEILGYDRDALLSLNMDQLGPPEETEKGLEMAQKLLAGKLSTYSRERILFHHSGRPIHAQITVSLVAETPETSAYFIAVIEDITHRKKLEQQLRHSQKMEAVGRLAAGVAHDFNNLLTVISGYTDLLLRDLPEGAPLSTELEQIRKAGDRAAELTRQLLTFGRRQVLTQRVLDLNGVVTEVRGMLERLMPENVKIVFQPGAGLGRVKADAGQMEQVLVNLVINARDAMPRGGVVTLRTAEVVTNGNGDAVEGVPPGRHVALTVSDTGRGMDRETLSHLFEPFFTTKGPGKGSGLGLATAYGIVRQSGGQITVSSELGHGTTFTIYLPGVDEPLEEAAPPRPEAAVKGGDETVLLAEDDELVRLLTRHVLERYGYTVVEAADGEQAVRACADLRGRIDAVVTDVVMPQLSGPELVRRLGQIDPELKVLYLSGHTQRAIEFHGLRSPGVAILQKPFRPHELARKLRELLDGRGG